MSVVRGNDDESVVELADLLEVLKSSAEGVIKLEQISQSTVDVLDVHLFVDKLVPDISYILFSIDVILTAASDMSMNPVLRS
jgi:hypothetical protein